MNTGTPGTDPSTLESCQCCPGPVPQDMFEILMNGIFAFTMTLIVKNNIPLPTSVEMDDIPFLLTYTQQIFEDGINFVFTFIILAVFYILFFEMLRNIRVLDRVFVYLSFGYVLSVIFLPLSLLLWNFSDIPIPYGILFHANILICGLAMILLWRYASRENRLLVHGTGEGTVRNLSTRLLLFPVTAVAGFFLDGWDVSFGIVPVTVLYAVPVVLFLYLSRDYS